jgi:two-component sensor histidine kinase
LVTVDLRRRLRSLGPEWVVAAGVALLCLALAAVARLAIDLVSPGALTFGFIYPICLLATLLAGWRAGLLTLVVAGLMAWYFVLNRGHGFGLADFKSQTNVALFFLTAAMVVFLADQAVIEQDKGLSDRELLIEEINHRTKNNFQTVISLLELQARRAADPVVASAMEAAVTRIGGLARSHRNLYAAGHAGELVALDSYLAELCDNLAEGPGVGGLVTMEAVLEPASLTRDRAVAVGIILNELLTNAFKHAFPPGQSGIVRVTLARADEGMILTVADDGVGLKASDRPYPASGLGRGLMDAFARQAGGTVTIENGELGGVLATLTLRP